MLLTPAQLIFLAPAVVVALLCTKRGWDVFDASTLIIGGALAFGWARLGALQWPLVGNVWSVPLAFAAVVWVVVRYPVVRRWLLAQDETAQLRKDRERAKTVKAQEGARVATLRREQIQTRLANTGVTQVVQPVAGRIRTAEWLDLANERPDLAPHVVVAGGTGAGKTTFMEALLSQRRGNLCILTPKNEQDDPWWGLPAIRIDKESLSFEPIERALAGVLTELKHRNANGYDPDAWLTVVIDDYPWIAKNCPTAPQVFEHVGNMGRSVRLRLVIGSQSTQVKALDMEGLGDMRSNFFFVELAANEGRRSAEMYRYQGNRPGDRRALELGEVWSLSQRAPSGVWWEPGFVPLSVRPLEREIGTPLPQTDGRAPREYADLIAYIKANPNADRDTARAAGLQFKNEVFGPLKDAIKVGIF